MRNRMALLAVCGVCLALIGCVSEERRFSGLLSDYSILKPDPTMQGALVYWNPDIDPKQYNAVLVEPVEIHFRNRNEGNCAKPEQVAAFRKFVTDEFTTAISKRTAITTESGPNVLRCRLQVANLQLTQLIDHYQRTVDLPDYMLGTANIEIVAHDSISGELVVAYVSPPGRAERYTAFLLAKPPDRWEAAEADVRVRVANIGNLFDHRVFNRGDFHVADYSD